MRNILSILWLILILYTIVDIVKSGGSTGKKAIWIVLVLLFPFLGSIGWFLFGRK